MQFGLYLVDNALLTPEDFVEALKLHIRSRPQLGALAVASRMISLRQMFAILDAQCDRPEERFGDTAVRKRFLRKKQVEELIAQQQKATRSIREVLIAEGFLPKETVDLHFREFRQVMAKANNYDLVLA